MIRLCLALLVSVSLVLPGAVMASGDHHQHVEASLSDHSHHHDHQVHAADDIEDESKTSLMCCHMIAGHCTATGVLADVSWTAALNPLARAELIIAMDRLHKGLSFEADPPPPRV